MFCFIDFTMSLEITIVKSSICYMFLEYIMLYRIKCYLDNVTLDNQFAFQSTAIHGCVGIVLTRLGGQAGGCHLVQANSM